MSDENSEKPEKPDPIEDVRKGLGLLFRAAKSTLDQLPTRQIEEAVVTGAREVSRAIENVTGAIDKQLFKRPPGSADAEAAHESNAEGAATEAKAEPTETKDEGAHAGDAGEPRGPRVG
jgi:hypothetical protein